MLYLSGLRKATELLSEKSNVDKISDSSDSFPQLNQKKGESVPVPGWTAHLLMQLSTALTAHTNCTECGSLININRTRVQVQLEAASLIKNYEVP